MNTASKIAKIISGFQSITLEEVQAANLMRRKDSKFVYSFLHLPTILPIVKKDYRVLEIDGNRSHPYLTAYYDTSDLEMYHMHHRGMANRHKIRFRRYEVSDLHFLEVKKKNAKGITIKNRIKTPGMDAAILTIEEEFLSSYSPYGHNGMIPVMENSFKRITFVSGDQTERITLDFDLKFTNLLSDNRLELPGVSITEIKYETFLSKSPFNAALRSSKIPPRRFSKYAIGLALLNDDLKQNLFKQKVRNVHQINSNYLLTQKNPHHA